MNCPWTAERTLPCCEGGVWCSIYNLGGNHGRISGAFRHLGKSAFDIPLAVMLDVSVKRVIISHRT